LEIHLNLSYIFSVEYSHCLYIIHCEQIIHIQVSWAILILMHMSRHENNFKTTQITFKKIMDMRNKLRIIKVQGYIDTHSTVIFGSRFISLQPSSWLFLIN